MNPTIAHNRLGSLVAAGELLTSYGVPVVPIKPKIKAPIPHSATGSWWVIDDPDDVAGVFGQVDASHGDANIALLAGRRRRSPVLVLDIDGPSGMARAHELEVTSGSNCWIKRTGGGRNRFQVGYFHETGLELRRHVRAQGAALDLIVDGYALVPPALTKSAYCWRNCSDCPKSARRLTGEKQTAQVDYKHEAVC